MHGGREGVVGGLAHVHIVVRMAELPPGQFVCPVGDHLVGVHVGLGARPRLPDHQREMAVERPGRHLTGCGFDHSQFFRRHLFRQQLMVCPGGCLLQNAEGVGDLPRHGFDAHADGEVIPASLCLRAPVSVGGDADLTHGIVFNPVGHTALNSVSEVLFSSYVSGPVLSIIAEQKPHPAAACRRMINPLS